jgi:subtilisin family serine protease
MADRHVVLRRSRPAPRDLPGPDAGAGVEPAVASAMAADVEDIESRHMPSVLRDPDVVAVAPVIPMKLIEPVAVPEAASPSDGPAAWGITAVGADTSPYTGAGVVVAVLDTGIDPAHPAFADVELIERDFTSEGNGDRHGHGTHCAGTIFGRDTDGQRIGVARGVTRALIGKVLGAGGGASDQIVSAIQWAIDSGAHVISMSLGIDFPGLVERLVGQGFPPALATSRALEAYRSNVLLFERLASLVRAQGAFGQTTIIVAAAGNESRRHERADFRIAVSPPAVAEGIVSVAALQQGPTGQTVAYFSNTGASVAGPGVGINSAAAGGGLVSMNGTSMATPHVAGVAALWAEKLKNSGSLSTLQLSARLIASGTTEGLNASFDPYDVGAGMVRAPQ